jgi:hypothetical protein
VTPGFVEQVKVNWDNFQVQSLDQRLGFDGKKTSSYASTNRQSTQSFKPSYS